MTKKLHISTGLSLPLDTVTSTLVVYGGKGMGKTNFASVLVEELDANGLRFAFIDPVGVSWGLRHSLDGKGRGIEILILGGIHGDIPIEPTGGAVVADLVVDESVNVLIDVSRRPDGSMWSIGERIRFVTDYSKRLYQRQGEKRRPIMQIYDEAARWAPQTVRRGEEQVAACMGAIAVLVEEGRNVGLGVMLLTLRSARLNKDVAELADCMIAFRTVGPNSRDAVLDWLGEHVDKKRLHELGETIRKLPVGSALVVSPGWLEFEGVVAFRARRTFDSSKTPKPGEQVRARGPGAKPDLPKYQQRMAETIERAAENDPKQIRKKYEARIVELEKHLRAKPAAAPAAARPPKVDPEKERERIKKLADRALAQTLRPVFAALRKIPAEITAATLAVDRAKEQINVALSKVAAAIGDLKAEADEIEKAGVAQIPEHFVAAIPVAHKVRPIQGQRIQPAPKPRPRIESVSTTTDGSLDAAEQRIVDAIAELEDIGVRPATRVQVAILANYSTLSGGTGAKKAGDLVTKGLISIPTTGQLELTDEGRGRANRVGTSISLSDLHSRLLRKLDDGERRIMEHIINVWPNEADRSDVAAATNYSTLSGGTGAANVAKLVDLGFVKIPRKGAIKASELLFPEGLA